MEQLLFIKVANDRVKTREEPIRVGNEAEQEQRHEVPREVRHKETDCTFGFHLLQPRSAAGVKEPLSTLAR